MFYIIILIKITLYKKPINNYSNQLKPLNYYLEKKCKCGPKELILIPKFQNTIITK
jgi:hypothetical protein